MKLVWVLFKLFVLFVLFFAMVRSANHVDSVRPHEEVQAFLYIPKNKHLRSFAFGFENEYADIMWINSLQAFHKHFFQKMRFHDASEALGMVTDLDKRFYTAYESGTQLIISAKKSPLAGIQYLQDGTEKIPEEGWIWLLLAEAYFKERTFLASHNEMTEIEATKKAIFPAQKAAELTKNPILKDQATRLLRFLILRDRYSTFDIITWLEFYQKSKGHEVMQKDIEQKMQYRIATLHIKIIENALKSYYGIAQKYPQGLEELNLSLSEPKIEDIPQIMQILIQIKDRYPLEKSHQAIEEYLTNSLHAEFPGNSYNFDDEKVTSPALEMKELYKILNNTHKLLYDVFLKKGQYPTLQEFLDMKKPKLPLDKDYLYNEKTGALDYTPK